MFLTAALVLSVTQCNVFWRLSLPSESIVWRVREKSRNGLASYYVHEECVLENGEKTVGSPAVPIALFLDHKNLNRKILKRIERNLKIAERKPYFRMLFFLLL